MKLLIAIAFLVTLCAPAIAKDGVILGPYVGDFPPYDQFENPYSWPFRPANPAPILEHPANPPLMKTLSGSREQTPTPVTDQWKLPAEDSPEMKPAWKDWHKRISHTIQKRFQFFARAAFRSSPALLCEISFVVSRDGRIGNLQMKQKSANVLFNAVVLSFGNAQSTRRKAPGGLVGESVNLIVSERAEQDLDGIEAYIGNDNPAAAVRFVQRLTERFEQLTHNPRSGRQRTSAWASQPG